MRGINKAILIGNLGRDPEIRFTTSGGAVANFSIATTNVYTDKNGERQEVTEWHRIVAWGRLAEICNEYLTKGSSVYIEGSIRTRSWEDKEGKTRYTTEIVARDMQMLGRRTAQSSPDDATVSEGLEHSFNTTDDDIPF